MYNHEKNLRSVSFKKKIALEALQEKRTIAEIASAYEIHPVQVSQWKKELIDSADSLFESRQTKMSKQKDKKRIFSLKDGRTWVKVLSSRRHRNRRFD